MAQVSLYDVASLIYHLNDELSGWGFPASDDFYTSSSFRSICNSWITIDLNCTRDGDRSNIEELYTDKI